MGSIQALLATVRLSLESGQLFVGFSVFGSIGVMGGFLGRMICGWACPFGFIQELLYKLPSKKFGIPRVLRYGKYFFLLFFVILLPLFVVDEFGGGTTWFCKYVCPTGTLEAGLPMLALQPTLRAQLGTLFLSKFVVMVLFLVWSVLSSRPFCRTTCPLGAFYALFNKVKMVRLRLDENRCTNCHACHAVCPMGVKFNESPDDRECISCMACMSKACRFNAIYLDVGGVPIGAEPSSTEPQGIRVG